jgi:predicted glycosyltransferase
MIYSQDGMGLGHLRRTHNIAQEIIAQASQSEILVLADSPVAPFFAPVRGIRYRKLPTILKERGFRWRTIDGGSSIAHALEKRAASILATLRGFRPDAVLVDHMPLGALGELRPMLDEIQRMSRPPKLLLGLRDILDDPETLRRVWSELEAYDYLRLYDKVLIYGCREIFDADDSYGLTPNAREITYSYYVVHRSGTVGHTPPLDEPYVLVMGGGGADAFPLANAFLDAWPSVKRLGLQACILTGPNMSPPQRARLRARARELHVHMPPRKVDAIPWIRQSAAVVSMAGYNSLCEVLRWGRPTLIVPRRGPSAEQRMRARRFQQRRIAALLDPDDLSGEALARELNQLLTEDGIPDSANIPPLDGASRAATAILAALRAPAESTRSCSNGAAEATARSPRRNGAETSS